MKVVGLRVTFMFPDEKLNSMLLDVGGKIVAVDIDDAVAKEILGGRGKVDSTSATTSRGDGHAEQIELPTKTEKGLVSEDSFGQIDFEQEDGW